jgi:hypothetical protein
MIAHRVAFFVGFVLGKNTAQIGLARFRAAVTLFAAPTPSSRMSGITAGPNAA